MKKPVMKKNTHKTRADFQHGFLKAFFNNHQAAASNSFARLKKNIFSTLFTSLVIALTLCLPLMLMIFVKNMHQLTAHIENSSQITLYLRHNLSPQSIDNLINQLSVSNNIAEVKYISPEDGLKEFASHVGLDHITQHLHQNPLPPVLELTPTMLLETPEALNHFATELQSYPEVEEVQLDVEWMKKLSAIMTLFKDITIGIGIILSFGVIVIVGHTIKFAIENYRQEIEVFRMIGASDAMIRRPFLYTGIFYGLLGTLLSFIIILIFAACLSQAISHLANAYSISIHLSLLSFMAFIKLCFLGMLFGLIGAWFTVNRHLKGNVTAHAPS
jgi:cell division transport system permease protein